MKSTIVRVLAITLLLSGMALAARGQKKSDFPIGSYWDGGFIAVFTTNGKLTISEEDWIKAEALYKIDGNRIDIIDKEAGGDCPSVGTYTWKFDGESLTFVKVKDECEGRVHHLTSRRWPRVK